MYGIPASVSKQIFPFLTDEPYDSQSELSGEIPALLRENEGMNRDIGVNYV